MILVNFRTDFPGIAVGWFAGYEYTHPYSSTDTPAFGWQNRALLGADAELLCRALFVQGFVELVFQQHAFLLEILSIGVGNRLDILLNL